jgi:hypothetical protein
MARKATPPAHRVVSDAEFHAEVLKGGASRQVQTLRPVTVGEDDGYMVGGKPTPGTGKPYPARRIPKDSFTPADVANHLADLHTTFPEDETVHQGGWMEGDEAVLDASDRIQNKGEAILQGYLRPNDNSPGQDAIFDVKAGKDRPLGKRAVS